MHTPLAKWAVALAAVAAVLLALWFVPWITTASASVMTVAVVCLGVGGLASFVGFVLAVWARAKGERWTLLWFPLTLFPVLAALPVLFVSWLMAGGA